MTLQLKLELAATSHAISNAPTAMEPATTTVVATSTNAATAMELAMELAATSNAPTAMELATAPATKVATSTNAATAMELRINLRALLAAIRERFRRRRRHRMFLNCCVRIER